MVGKKMIKDTHTERERERERETYIDSDTDTDRGLVQFSFQTVREETTKNLPIYNT